MSFPVFSIGAVQQADLLKQIFTRFKSLESLAMKAVKFQNEDLKYLINAIQSKQLQHLELIDSKITDYDLFQMVCNAHRGSAIKSLRITNSGLNFQTNLNMLIDVLPDVPFLKTLDLQGQLRLDKTRLISILDRTQINNVGLSFVGLSDREADQLARKIPSTNLKYLDVLYNALNFTSVNILQTAMNARSGNKFVFSNTELGRE